MRKTKIVCTMGPSTEDDVILRKLVETGMNVARFNFSHGSHEEQKGRMDQLKKIRKECNKPVAMLLDTKGPEIRVANFKEGRVTVEPGQMFCLNGDPVEGNEMGVGISYPELYKDVEVGTRILIDDGLIEMEVISIKDKAIHCMVKNGGEISNHKGVNVPNIRVNLPYMSKKDTEDIIFGIENDVDFIAASFVRSAEDVKEIRKLLKENDGEEIHIIAKIENQEGVDHINEIIEASDGIMIARGDMGVELPGEEVPIVQKLIIKKVYEAGKQVITATQMLDSMMKNPRPTRAEATDVANAIYDGTSAIMLSGETAAGKYPVEALETMIKIADRTERDIDYKKRFFSRERTANPDITDAICHATCTTAHDLNAKAIVALTKSGRSVRMISRYRPECLIIGGTMEEKVTRQLNMSWGVQPILLKEKKEIFDLFEYAIETAKEKNILNKGDVAVVTSGVPIGKSGTTNMIKVEIVQ